MSTTLEELRVDRDEIKARLDELETTIRVLSKREADAAIIRKTEPPSPGNGTTPRRRRGRPPRALDAEPTVTPPPGKMAPGELANRVLAAVDKDGTKRVDLIARFKDVRPNVVGLAIARHIKAGRLLDAGDTVHHATA